MESSAEVRATDRGKTIEIRLTPEAVTAIAEGDTFDLTVDDPSRGREDWDPERVVAEVAISRMGEAPPWSEPQDMV